MSFVERERERDGGVLECDVNGCEIRVGGELCIVLEFEERGWCYSDDDDGVKCLLRIYCIN